MIKRKIAVNYRKLYENHFGEIPVDSDGRSYEIHHIDGDYTNNRPDNLVALSIAEHHNVHLKQRDYQAARLIALRMGKSPQELRDLARLGALKQVEEGKNYFTTKESAENIRTRNLKWSMEGRHPLQQEHNKVAVSNTQKHLAMNEKHPFQRDDVRRKSAERIIQLNGETLKNGTHPFQRESVKEMVSKRTSERNKKLAESGMMFMQSRDGKRQLSEITSKRMKGNVIVYDKEGKCHTISTERYNENKRSDVPISEWEFAQNRSLEGQRRRRLVG